MSGKPLARSYIEPKAMAAVPNGDVVPDVAMMAAQAPAQPKARKKMSSWLQLALVVLGAIGLMVATAYLYGQDINWLFTSKTVAADIEIVDVAVLLAPLAALALAIERMLETFFDLFEQSMVRVSKLGTATVDGLSLFQRELDEAWDAFDRAPKETSLEEKAGLMDTIVAINKEILDLKKDPVYIAAKRRMSIWGGIVLGLFIATVTDLGFFELLNISTPRFLDMLATGFVIGTGSAPMHSLIGILQGAKDTLGSFGGSLTPIRKQLDDLKTTVDKLG